MTPTIAVDLGGTHVRAALVAGDGSIIAHDRQATPRADPKPTIIPDLIQQMAGLAAAESLAPDVPASDPLALRAVVGLPGIIDHVADRLVAAPNLPQAWMPFLTDEWLEAAAGLETTLANDADLAAVGESTFGAGREFRDVVYVTISTGVGAGVVVADRLVRGRFSGGEIGHTVVDRAAAADGRACTVEDLGSGTAIERAAAEAGITARGSELADLVRSGDGRANEIWNAAIEAVGIGIVNLAWIVAPQVVVVGGGVGMNGDLVVPILEQQLKTHGPDTGGTIHVETAKLGDAAALSGAAAWRRAVGRG